MNEIESWIEKSSEELSAIDIAQENENWEQVQRGLLALPLKNRVVVVMYYLNDLSIREISEILDISIGTVKSRLHYGRKALKSSLKLLQRCNGLKTPDIRHEDA